MMRVVTIAIVGLVLGVGRPSLAGASACDENGATSPGCVEWLVSADPDDRPDLQGKVRAALVQHLVGQVSSSPDVGVMCGAGEAWLRGYAEAAEDHPERLIAIAAEAMLEAGKRRAADPSACSFSSLPPRESLGECAFSVHVGCARSLLQKANEALATDGCRRPPPISMEDTQRLRGYVAGSEGYVRLGEQIDGWHRCCQAVRDEVERSAATVVADAAFFEKMDACDVKTGLSEGLREGLLQVLLRLYSSNVDLGLSWFNDVLARYQVPRGGDSDQPARDRLVQVSRERPGKAGALALLAAAAAGQATLHPLLLEPVCRLSYEGLEASDLPSANPRAMAGLCPDESSEWSRTRLEKLFGTASYDAFLALVRAYAFAEATGYVAAIRDHEKAILKDVGKAHRELVTLQRQCEKRSFGAAQKLRTARTLGVLDAERAHALAACLKSLDEKALPAIERGLAKACAPARRSLAAHVAQTRGKEAAKAFQDEIEARVNARSVPVAMAGLLVEAPRSPLALLAERVADCSVAELRARRLQELVKARRYLDAVPVFLAISASLPLETSRKNAAALHAGLRDTLAAQARALAVRGLHGTAWLQLLLAERFFPSATPVEPGAAALQDRLSRSATWLASFASEGASIDGPRAPELQRVASGRLSVRWGGGASSDPARAVQGVGAELVLRELHSATSSDSSTEPQRQRWVRVTTAPNQEKIDACNRVPDLQQQLANAQTALQAAQEACKEASKQASNAIGGWGGLLASVATDVGCNVAADELLVSDTREDLIRNDVACKSLPDETRTEEPFFFDYDLRRTRWSFSVAYRVEVRDVAGAVVCTLEKARSSDVTDESHPGDADTHLEADPLTEPDSDRQLDEVNAALLDDLERSVDECLRSHAEALVEASLAGRGERWTEEERRSEARVWAAALRRGVEDIKQRVDAAAERGQLAEFVRRVEQMGGDGTPTSR